MSDQQLAALLDAAAADPAVAARFATVRTSHEAASVAADLGYDVTAAELEAAGTDMRSRELSDAELAGAAGGGSPSLDPMLCPTGHCQSLYGLGCA